MSSWRFTSCLLFRLLPTYVNWGPQIAKPGMFLKDELPEHPIFRAYLLKMHKLRLESNNVERLHGMHPVTRMFVYDYGADC